jgi:hypothetical protein
MDESDRPTWWRRNEDLKRRLDIPAYEPPRFADGVYVHDVIDDIETEFDVDVQLVGYDTTFPEDWTVTVDGEEVTDVGHGRDTDGNTVFDVSSDRFRNRLRERLT